MTKQDLLKALVQSYGDIEKLLMDIGKIMEDVLNKTSNKDGFTAERFCADFDIILQHTLIEIAIADNSLAPEELATAKSITNYGDLMLLCKSEGMDIDWENFLGMNIAAIQKWLERMRKPIRRVTSEFVAGFAAVDAAMEDDDLLNDFTKKICGLFSVFTYLEDGELDDYETEAIASSELMFAMKNIAKLIAQSGK